MDAIRHTDVRTCAEEILYLLRAQGVEYLFLNPGTDSAPLQEAAAVLEARQVPAPLIVTSSFESVALAAAHGYWQMTRRAQAVFVHVDVGRSRSSPASWPRPSARSSSPAVAVVLNNNGYRASRRPVLGLFPDGVSAARGSVTGTRFACPPDFAGLATACGAYGERVEGPATLGDALQRAFKAADDGRAAVLDVAVSE